MLHEDVAFKTISDRYTNSRMVPFLTHIDEFRYVMGHIMRKPVLSYVNNKGADQSARTRYTDSVSRCRLFVINHFDRK